MNGRNGVISHVKIPGQVTRASRMKITCPDLHVPRMECTEHQQLLLQGTGGQCRGSSARAGQSGICEQVTVDGEGRQCGSYWKVEGLDPRLGNKCPQRHLLLSVH